MLKLDTLAQVAHMSAPQQLQHAQAVLDTYFDDTGPIPDDPLQRNAWYRGLVIRAFRAARHANVPLGQRVYDNLGRKAPKVHKVVAR